MPALCFVTTCMGRLPLLRQTLGRLAEQPDCSCVVVDHSCPQGAGDWVSRAHPEVTVVRVEGRRKFNVCVARNAAVPAVDAPWVCFIDCDILVETDFARRVLPRLEPGAFYRPWPLDEPGLYGTCVVRLEDFDRLGGYDEVMEGWSEEDRDLYDCLQVLGVRQEVFPSSLVTHLPHDDWLRTAHYDVKDRRVSRTVNQLYRYIKLDLMRLAEELMGREDRVHLYRVVEAHMSRAIAANRDLSVTVSMSPDGVVIACDGVPDATGLALARGRSIERELRYHFDVARLHRVR
jgi:glycosyltransferase involved in cell wall biosynthesis